MRFYIEQYGLIWRLNRDALQRILEEGAEDGAYYLGGPGVTEAQHKTTTFHGECVLPKALCSDNVVVLHLLDQPQDWFVAALDALNKHDYTTLRYL